MRISDWSSDVCSSDLRLSAFSEWRDRRDDPVRAQGRRWRSGRNLTAVPGSAMRAAILRPGYAGRDRGTQRHYLAMARRRMGLVHAGRPQAAVLALEPEQRLGARSRDPRLRSEERRVGKGWVRTI